MLELLDHLLKEDEFSDIFREMSDEEFDERIENANADQLQDMLEELIMDLRTPEYWKFFEQQIGMEELDDFANDMMDKHLSDQSEDELTDMLNDVRVIIAKREKYV